MSLALCHCPSDCPTKPEQTPYDYLSILVSVQHQKENLFRCLHFPALLWYSKEVKDSYGNVVQFMNTTQTLKSSLQKMSTSNPCRGAQCFSMDPDVSAVIPSMARQMCDHMGIRAPPKKVCLSLLPPLLPLSISHTRKTYKKIIDFRITSLLPDCAKAT
jgi:hypothetical protein